MQRSRCELRNFLETLKPNSVSVDPTLQANNKRKTNHFCSFHLSFFVYEIFHFRLLRFDVIVNVDVVF